MGAFDLCPVVAIGMHQIKVWIRAFFGFSRGETNAFIILLPLMIFLLFSEPLYRAWLSRRPPDFSRDQFKADSLMASLQWDLDTLAVTKKTLPIHFFAFDPNTVSEPDLIRLGLSASMAHRIVRYREKGGVFRKKEALLKIYGLDSGWFEQAKLWINIPPIASDQLLPAQVSKRATDAQVIDINLADSLQLLNVYGIGPALSKRIRTFRDKLGGYVSIDQVQEVYGLDSTTVQKIKRKFMVTTDFRPVQIDLNTVTLEEFRHPYVKKNEAMAILAFRLQHGRFQSIDQLAEIKILSPKWIDKMKPYLKIESP